MHRRSGFVYSKIGAVGGVGACLLGLSLATMACSSEVPESEPTVSGSSGMDSGSGGSGVGSGSGSGSSTGAGAGAGATGGSIIVPTGGTGGGSGGTMSLDECATHTEKAEIVPVHLVFLMDQSSSMGGSEMADPQERWIPVTTALRGFFQDPASAGLVASMILFPTNQNTTTTDYADPMVEPLCDPADYATPPVPLTELPSPAFGAAFDMLGIPNESGTPTLPAIAGAIDYALAQRTADPTRRVVIVMVTDGQPSNCEDIGNSVQAAADEAAAVADEISTYVVGVGQALNALNTIAEAGGTGEAILVAVDDPAQTQADLAAAIAEIRGQVIACDMVLPLPPAGQTLDPSKVNVSVTPAGGMPTTLAYDQECLTGVGWKYDDPAVPTEIQLCDSTCTEVKADLMGAVDVILGCQRNDIVR